MKQPYSYRFKPPCGADVLSRLFHYVSMLWLDGPDETHIFKHFDRLPGPISHSGFVCCACSTNTCGFLNCFTFCCWFSCGDDGLTGIASVLVGKDFEIFALVQETGAVEPPHFHNKKMNVRCEYTSVRGAL